MMQRSNGLGNAPRLTQSSYQQAVSETVRGIQGADTDQDMADAWGVSSGTVNNARNRRHDLSGLPLLKLGERFGPDALNTVLRLIGAKAVPLQEVTLDVASIPCNVAEAVPTLIRLFHDGDASDADIRQLDREGVIDRFVVIADMMVQRRDALRLKAVS